MQALRALKQVNKTTIELQATAQNEDYADVQQKMKGTVWASGCHSWYQTADGRIDTLWPGFTWQYWLKTRRFDAEGYALT